MFKIDRERKDKMLKNWQEKLLEKYPIKPVIEITSYIEECTTKIMDKLIEALEKGTYEGVEEPIDDLMRFLATDRDLSPGQSISMLLYLKTLFLTNFPEMKKEEFIKINGIIDTFACIGFNKYMLCREKIFDLRVKQKEKELEMFRRAMEAYEHVYRSYLNGQK